MKVQEIIQYIQSANINFLIGSGASRPYLANFYPRGDEYSKTINNYKALLSTWNGIMNKRYSRLLNKQVNLFSTNIDLMVEQASIGMGIELNDGFKGSVEQVYDESSFMRSVNQTSLHYQYTSEIPVFNLLKVHGSINWVQNGSQGIKNERFLINYTIDEALKKIPADLFVDIHYTEGFGDLKEKTYDQLVTDANTLKVKDTAIYQPFLEAYKQLIIVNPTKRKFEQTVMDYHFYELMRIYANALEKENALLFVTGFSFADEHIASITKRAADSNPTLQIVIFAYCDAEEDSFKSKLGINPVCLNNNITILTPSKFKDNNRDDAHRRLTDSIENFDLETIAKVFSFLESHIH